MTTPARLMAYPLVMLSGAVLGGTFLSVHTPFNQAEAHPGVAQAPPRKPSPPQGRLGAETPELHQLRMAEAEMFPVGYDRDLSAPELWDQSLSPGTGGWAPNGAPVQRERGARLGSRIYGPDFLKGLNRPNIPVAQDRAVAKYIRYFTTNSHGRKMLTTWIRRSGRYHGIIEQALRKHGVPSDVESVVYIESGFWPTARSTAGAVGLWQFMPKTARVYGLTVDKSVDERRSIWKATDAAAGYLSDLYDRLQSWDLALAAFNVGYKKLSRVIAEQGTDDFWALRSIDGALPRETSLYVPKVLAVSVIVRNLKHFELDSIEQAPPISATRIKVPPGIRLSLIARAAGTSLRALRGLNPEFRLDTTPDRGGPVDVHIPAKGLGRARVMLPRLLQEQGDDPLDMKVSPDFDWGTNEDVDENGKGRLDRGSVGNGLSTRKHAQASSPPAYDFSNPGKPAVVPGAGAKTAGANDTPVRASNAFPVKGVDAGAAAVRSKGAIATVVPVVGKSPPAAADPGDQLASMAKLLALGEPTTPRQDMHSLAATRIPYRVQRGDTAWGLSQVWGVPLSRIVRENHLENPDVLPVGRLLILDIPPFSSRTSSKEQGKK